MADRKSFYIPTPIYYVNDVPHIGHAYTTVNCDFIARFKRLDGYDVMFLSGTDEHGEKVEQAAIAEGVTPQELVDRVSVRFRDVIELLQISIDDFIRTTEQRQTKAVLDLWRKLADAGDIYLGKYEGWYSVSDEEYYTDAELTKNAEGELIAPSGKTVEWKEEPSYFFRLSAYQDRLLELYERNPNFVRPQSRMNEVTSFVQSGLRDISISRTSMEWGQPVPGDNRHVMYVWIDALTNYITAVGYPDEASEDFAKFWPADLHMVGKDILRFHTVYWPAFLMSGGVELPKQIFAHGWLTIEGQKMSKSLGNVIDPFALVDAFGLDQVRYFFLREVSFGSDGDFSQDALIRRIDGDLANDFGNLAQRSLSMIAKNCAGKLPKPDNFTDNDQKIMATAEGALDLMRKHIDQLANHRAVEALWSVVADANRYFAGEEPWALVESDPARRDTILYVTAEVVRYIAILAQPIIPNAASLLLDQLAVPANKRTFAELGAKGRRPSGAKLPAPEGALPRHDGTRVAVGKPE